MTAAPNEVTECKGVVTVIVELLEVKPEATAETKEVPLATPVTTPVLEFTVACEGVPLLHTGLVQGAVEESE